MEAQGDKDGKYSHQYLELKEFLSEEKKEIKYVGKGSSKLRFKVVLLDLFSSNVCKENLHRLGL